MGILDVTGPYSVFDDITTDTFYSIPEFGYKRTGSKIKKLRGAQNLGHKNKVIANRRRKNKASRKARRKHR